jgi:hypothetical protein
VSGNVSGVQFISTATTGTAPFQVSSTSLVTNLNSDLLDNYHASTEAIENTIVVRNDANFIKARAVISPDTLLLRGPSSVYISISSYTENFATFSVFADPEYEVLRVTNIGDVTIRNNLEVIGIKLHLGTDAYDLGYTSDSIALEKVTGGILAINSNGDFYGGVRVNGPGMDVAGNLSVNGTITGTLSGNASTASRLQTARTISLGGALSGSAAFDGSTDVTISADINTGAVGTTQLADSSVTNIKVADNAITTSKIANGSVTASKLASGAVIGNLGYTPVNKAGDTMTGTLTVPGINGNNTDIFLINARNLGMELRIDEDSSGGDTFKITRGVNGSNTLLNIDTSGNANISGTLTVTGTITGTLNGNASTASKLQNARNIALGGALSGSASFDGSTDVTINASINAGAVGTTQLVDNAVTTSKIADGSVTYSKLAQDVIDAINNSGGGGGGARIFQTTIGNGTDSTYTITHNFNTTNVEVSLILLSTNEKIGAKVVVLNVNQIQVSFISPIATNSVKVIVIG